MKSFIREAIEHDIEALILNADEEVIDMIFDIDYHDDVMDWMLKAREVMGEGEDGEYNRYVTFQDGWPDFARPLPQITFIEASQSDILGEQTMAYDFADGLDTRTIEIDDETEAAALVKVAKALYPEVDESEVRAGRYIMNSTVRILINSQNFQELTYLQRLLEFSVRFRRRYFELCGVVLSQQIIIPPTLEPGHTAENKIGRSGIQITFKHMKRIPIIVETGHAKLFHLDPNISVAGEENEEPKQAVISKVEVYVAGKNYMLGDVLHLAYDNETVNWVVSEWEGNIRNVRFPVLVVEEVDEDGGIVSLVISDPGLFNSWHSKKIFSVFVVSRNDRELRNDLRGYEAQVAVTFAEVETEQS